MRKALSTSNPKTLASASTTCPTIRAKPCSSRAHPAFHGSLSRSAWCSRSRVSCSSSSFRGWSLAGRNSSGRTHRESSRSGGQPGSWTPDGARLTFYRATGTGEDRDLWVLTRDGDAVSTVSTEGGTEPVWSRDGTQLFFRNGSRGVEGTSASSVTMALSPGTRRGVYEVSAKIGQGGMGEVYRARQLVRRTQSAGAATLTMPLHPGTTLGPYEILAPSAKAA